MYLGFTEQDIKRKIKNLLETSPKIHMTLSLQKPKQELREAEARLVGAYAHIFQVEAFEKGIVKRHSIPYADILTGHVTVKELELL